MYLPKIPPNIMGGSIGELFGKFHEMIEELLAMIKVLNVEEDIAKHTAKFKEIIDAYKAQLKKYTD